MSNIYLKVTTLADSTWHSQNFDFLSIKMCYQASFLGAPTCSDNTEF